MCLPGKFGLRRGSRNDEMSAKTMNAPPTRPRPSLWPDDRPATTGEIVENIRGRKLSELGGRRRSVGTRAPEVEHLVDRGRDHGACRGADVPDPGVRPVVSCEL